MEDTNQQTEATFNQLETITTDPLIAQIYEKAHEFEDMVNALEDVSTEDRVELINELDAMWPFSEEEMPISGRVSFLNQDTNRHDFRYCEDEIMRSKGFCFVEDGEKYVDGEVVPQYKAAHYLVGYVDTEKTQLGYLAGRLDDVDIECPRQSIEKIENDLRYFYPEVIEEVDCVILNCNTEEEAIHGLKDFTIEVTPSELDDEQLAMSLQNYITTRLEFDRELPYMVTLSGDCYIHGGEDDVISAHLSTATSGLADVVSVRFLPKDATLRTDQKQELVPCLQMLLYQASKSSQPVRLYVPAANISKLSSARRTVYESTE